MTRAARRRQRAESRAPELIAAPAAAQRGAPRWVAVVGVFVYCCLCWTLIGIATLSVYRQFTPHEVVAERGAGGDHTARR